MRNLKQDQKKLQESLNSPRLRLRYNRLHGFCQVWYFPVNDIPYVVLNIEDNYNLCWAIHKLKARQKTGRELKDFALKHLEAEEQVFDKKNYNLSREMAELLDDRRKGKIVSSIRG